MSTDPETGTVPQCYTHTDRSAGGFCVSCGKPICSECTVEIEGKNNCKNCVAEKLAPPARTSSQLLSRFSNKQLMGFGGCFLLSVGTFAPLVSYLGERMNFFQQGQSDGSIVLALAAVSLIILLKKKFKFLWITGGASLATIAYDFKNTLDIVNDRALVTLSGSPQLEWGWLALFIGSALLFAAAWNKKAV